MAARNSKRKRAKRAATVGRAGASGRAAKPKTRKSAPRAAVTARLERCQRLVAGLQKKIARLERQRMAEQGTHRRRLASARRQFEQQLTRMVQEIGHLRFHEARSRALERMLAELGVDASLQVPNVAESSAPGVTGGGAPAGRAARRPAKRRVDAVTLPLSGPGRARRPGVAAGERRHRLEAAAEAAARAQTAEAEVRQS